LACHGHGKCEEAPRPASCATFWPADNLCKRKGPSLRDRGPLNIMGSMRRGPGVQSNLSLAANAAWSDGHNPPLPGGRVLSPILFPRSLMFSTLDGRVSEKIMSTRS
jgi:hypothetical protein